MQLFKNIHIYTVYIHSVIIYIYIYIALFYSSYSTTCFSVNPIFRVTELENWKVVSAFSYCAHCIKITRIRYTSGSKMIIEMSECNNRMHEMSGISWNYTQ